LVLIGVLLRTRRWYVVAAVLLPFLSIAALIAIGIMFEWLQKTAYTV
jgi:hypothetical protein